LNQRENRTPAPDDGGGQDAPRDSLPEILRRAREEYGQDLRTVAQILRIRYVYLEAIEEGRFEQLPGTTYAVGFLRTYADFLGLDSDEIVERFKDEATGVERKTELVFPEPVSESKIPGGAIILISVLLLAVAYGGWLYLSNQGKSVADLIPAMPESLQALLDDGEADTGTEMAAETPAAMAPAALDEPAEEAVEQPAEETPVAAEASPQPPDETAGTETAAGETMVPAAPVETAAVPASPESVAPATIEPSVTTEIAVAPTAPEPAAPAQVARPFPAETPSATAPAEAEPEPVVSERAAEVQPAAEALIPAAPAAADPAAIMDQGAATGDRGTAPEELVAVAPTPQTTLIIPAVPTTTQTVVIPDDRIPRVYGEKSANTRIVLRAVQDSWVQVRDAQNALLLTRVLQSGDTYFVPNQEGLTLLTGNAGGIEIEVDGVIAPRIGPVGTVRRDIPLEPERLKTGTTGSR
jgi:cytoskeletal protein RodZ